MSVCLELEFQVVATLLLSKGSELGHLLSQFPSPFRVLKQACFYRVCPTGSQCGVDYLLPGSSRGLKGSGCGQQSRRHLPQGSTQASSHHIPLACSVSEVLSFAATLGIIVFPLYQLVDVALLPSSVLSGLLKPESLALFCV